MCCVDIIEIFFLCNNLVGVGFIRFDRLNTIGSIRNTAGLIIVLANRRICSITHEVFIISALCSASLRPSHAFIAVVREETDTDSLTDSLNALFREMEVVLQLWLATKGRESPNLSVAGLLEKSFGQSIF